MFCFQTIIRDFHCNQSLVVIMVKGRGKQKNDRQAVAKANGYVCGANQEDKIRNDNHYSDHSIALQNRVLNDYRV